MTNGEKMIYAATYAVARGTKQECASDAALAVLDHRGLSAEDFEGLEQAEDMFDIFCEMVQDDSIEAPPDLRDTAAWEHMQDYVNRKMYGGGYSEIASLWNDLRAAAERLAGGM